MDEKDLQTIQANIDKKRLEIEKEIEEKKKKVEEEIAARRRDMERKLSEQRAEMERRHQEQIRLMNRQVNARELAAKIEAEFLAGKAHVEANAKKGSMGASVSGGLTDDAENLMKVVTTVKPLRIEDAVERGIAEARQKSPVFLDGKIAKKQVLKEVPVAEELAVVKEEKPKDDGIVKFVKNIFHKDTPEEIAEDIAEKDEKRVAKEKAEEAEERTKREKAERERKKQEDQERLRRKKEEKERIAKAKLEQEERKREKNNQNSFFRKKDDERTEMVQAAEQTVPLDDKEEEMRKKDKKSLWIRAVLFVVVAVLLALTSFYGAIFVMKHIIGATDVGTVYPRTKISNDSGEVIEGVLSERINVLVMGTDYGDSEADTNDPKRTDAMLLLSVDPKKDKVSVLSIPRDTKVILSGHRDPQKINAAYAFGGVMLAKQTVANLLGVPITHYALADWQAFTKIVDIIGGVDILVEHDMKYDDPYANLHIDIKKGYQHLDGTLAGQYVRYRSDELGDIGRTQRQQLFVRSAVKQMFKVGNIIKIPSILKTVSDNVETDMSFVTMLKVANSVKVFGEKNIKTGTLGGENSDEDGISYWLTNDDAIKRSLKELDIPSSKMK